MIPLEMEVVEHYHAEYNEHNEGYNFLHDLELHERIGTTITIETDAVGGHLETVFNKCYPPRDQYHSYKGPAAGDAR